MAMELQVSLDQIAGLRPENHLNGEGGSGLTLLSQDNDAAKNKVKKPTRQWAAWTHQEEESFFSALRQNFEKITCRVQSKNKDQVRHYYYRLVRRMNKLLGPDLCLDARNCKETNAAMLRWWSLLEKYSCKASKLHLKPRRFKLFVETLESQLLKDRKKNVRKRVSQGENSSMISPTSVSNLGRVSGPESRVAKAALVDNQNFQKFGTAKGPSLNRNLSLGINRGNTKARSSALKAAKHQHKTGMVSKAAYKRWEKAAIAGVSLVADAAEHIERSSFDKEVEHVRDTPAQIALEYCMKDIPSMVDNLQSSAKLKLQLFPIDDATRRALESDSHNPHLELTLSTRKKISSVLEHLHRKWGSSSIASGELMLLPYPVEPLNLSGYHKWTKDSTLSAADVYSLIGKPPVFRLRYGWFSFAEPIPATCQAPLSCATDNYVDMSTLNKNLVETTLKAAAPCNGSQKILATSDNMLSGRSVTVALSSAIGETVSGASSSSGINSNDRSRDDASGATLSDREKATRPLPEEDQNPDEPRRYKAASPAGGWADSLTNISVGDLLSELPHNVEPGCIDLPEPRNFECVQPISQSCDSFDAAIAAHICRHQSISACEPTLMSHASSIWDGEETCDAFSFQKKGVSSEGIQCSFRNSFPEIGGIGKTRFAESDEPEEPNPEEPLTDDPTQDVDFIDKCQSYQHTSDNSPGDLNGLTDFYWPDSLGPLDLDFSSCRYRSDDLILSDSLGGLNRLIASSLDAFQNCSFFGTDKKEPTSTVGAAGEISSDMKISAEV
ncbi:OLC1v1012355C3 [Oldenlandia corymbosa var. corymbosa]|uniref:OLC1v1012355C3 n=1 Tax=Oldenlandia corymbosa var. corymbosa TaxID=529605 RepID=A0AAV1DVS1_OLDCO|nr:OLC1v1012355C3 [Oldenlandia corymbosa var. corymbosa]